jgi:DNA-binding HxlR family transcriptional regulator
MYQGNPPRAEYVLTDRGRELAGVVNALYKWGEAHTEDPAQK